MVISILSSPPKYCKVCHRSIRVPPGNSGLQLICINLCRQEDDVHFSLVSVCVLARSCAGVTENKMEGLREDFKNNYKRFSLQLWHGKSDVVLKTLLDLLFQLDAYQPAVVRSYYDPLHSWVFSGSWKLQCQFYTWGLVLACLQNMDCAVQWS